MTTPGAHPPYWTAPVVRSPIRATVVLPGSKSLTNRLLVLAALSDTPTRLVAPLRARDTELMAVALAGLGATIADLEADWAVTPGPPRPAVVNCGLAGTVMRFVPPVAALAVGDSTFDGDPHARTRPMTALIDGLRQLGVDIDDEGRNSLPLTVRGRGGVPGGTVHLDASSSSQFVSALLLAGAKFDRGVEVVHTGRSMPSAPHIEMTQKCLHEAGVAVEQVGPTRWRVEPGKIDLPETTVEPDLSNAAPFLAAAMVTGGSVTVAHWPASTTQAGDALRALLADMGAEVRLTDAGLTVTGPAVGVAGLVPLRADLHDVSELTPVLAALSALPSGESRITGVAHIRGHETDRLAATATELRGVGAEVGELSDGLVIRGGVDRLHGGPWRAYADHRMAQAGALIGLAVPGIVVDDIGCTTKTMADFPGLWAEMISDTEQAGR
jgi:3-phosphoshikimate 1-carboxyvinyltransferase